MSQHWTKSPLPYFVTVQDESEVNQQTFSTARRNSLLAQNNSDSHINSSTSSSNVLAVSKKYYPEIKYVFQDDPDYYNIENIVEEDEEAIVLEMDSKGENVENYKSLAPAVQILDVSLDDRNSTKRITINSTRAELENLETLKPDKDLTYIKKLATLYKLRSQQLESIL